MGVRGLVAKQAIVTFNRFSLSVENLTPNGNVTRWAELCELV